MARPTDWSKLGLTSDPTPGDQTAIGELLAVFNTIKPEVDRIENTIAGIVGTASGGWTGQTADALRGQISDQLQKFFRGLQECFDEATPALDTYSKALIQYQGQADDALSKAQGLPDKDPGIAAYTTQANTAGANLTAAATTAASAINGAVGKLESALTPSEIFWEAFQWLALILSIVGMIFGGPLALLAWLANLALFLKTIVDFAQGNTNFLGLFLGFLGILAPMTEGIGGDLLKLIQGGIGKLGSIGTKFADGAATFLNDTKILLLDITRNGFVPFLKTVGVFTWNGLLWIGQKIVLIPGLTFKVAALTWNKFTMLDQYAMAGLKWAGGQAMKGIDFALTEIGTGRFVRLFLPVTKEEFTLLGFGGAWQRAMERALPGLVKTDLALADRFSALRLAKGAGLGGDSIAKVVLDTSLSKEIHLSGGVGYVQHANGLYMPEGTVLGDAGLKNLNTINTLVKADPLATHLGEFKPINAPTGVAGFTGGTAAHTIAQTILDYKPVEVGNLFHADSIAVNRTFDGITLQTLDKNLTFAKAPATNAAVTSVEHGVTATTVTNDLAHGLSGSATGAVGVVDHSVSPVQQALSLVKHEVSATEQLFEHELAGGLGTIDHTAAGEAGTLHDLAGPNIAVHPQPVLTVRPVEPGVVPELAAATKSFDSRLESFGGKLKPDVAEQLKNDFQNRVRSVLGGWRNDLRLHNPGLVESKLARMVDNLPKEFSRAVERTSWTDGIGNLVKQDADYLKLSAEGRARFDGQITTRGSASFDRLWSVKNAEYKAGVDLKAVRTAFTTDLRSALTKELARDDWMRKAGAAFEDALGHESEIAKSLAPQDLARVRQDFLDRAEGVFHDASNLHLDFNAGVQDRLAGALTHDLRGRLADSAARAAKVRSGLLKGRAIASDWAKAHPDLAAKVGEDGFGRLLGELGDDLRKVPPGSRPQVFNQVLKDFEARLGQEARLRTVLSDAAHDFHGTPGEAAKFRSDAVLAFAAGERGLRPDDVTSWLAWEKDHGDVFGATLEALHPVDKSAAWSKARIDLSRSFGGKLGAERVIAPKIEAATQKFDSRYEAWAEEHATLPVEQLDALRTEFQDALRKAGPEVLGDTAAFDALTGKLLDGLGGRLDSLAEGQDLAKLARLRFKEEVAAWAARTGATPSLFGFAKVTEEFEAHVSSLLAGARQGLIDGGKLDKAVFDRALDEHVAGIGGKLDKEAGLGAVEAEAFQKAYQDWLGHDVPLDGAFSAERLTALGDEFRGLSRTLTEGLDDAAAAKIVHDLAARLEDRFDLELRRLSRLTDAGSDFDRMTKGWKGPEGLRGMTADEFARVKTEYEKDVADLTTVPESFWTGAHWDARQIRTLTQKWDAVRGGLRETVPGRLAFETRLLDELSHASELLGDGAKFEHLATEFRHDFTQSFHDVWGNRRSVADWLAGERRTGDVFVHGPGSAPAVPAAAHEPIDPLSLLSDQEPIAVRPEFTTPKTTPQPTPKPMSAEVLAKEPVAETVVGKWGAPQDLTQWGDRWTHDINGLFAGNGILSANNRAMRSAIAKFNNANAVAAGLEHLQGILSSPLHSAADARVALNELAALFNRTQGNRVFSQIPTSTYNDTLESISAKLLAERDGAASDLHPWPFNENAPKPDYLLPHDDGTVLDTGGLNQWTFYAQATNVGDHLRLQVADPTQLAGKIQSAIQSKVSAYAEKRIAGFNVADQAIIRNSGFTGDGFTAKNVRVVVDMSDSAALSQTNAARPTLDELSGHVQTAITGLTDRNRLIQADLVVPGHYLDQAHPVVLSFDRDGVRVGIGQAGPAGWGPGGLLDTMVVGLHGPELSLLDRATLLHDGGLLLSTGPKDLELAAKVAGFDGVFRLITHFDKRTGEVWIHGARVPLAQVADLFRSGALSWREGQLILVVGCGAEDLAAFLRTELKSPTVGASHDMFTLHDGTTFTGATDLGKDGTVGVRTEQPWWTKTPDKLEATPTAVDQAVLKLYLPGESAPYVLGSDLTEAMGLLGFRPSVVDHTPQPGQLHAGAGTSTDLIGAEGKWAPPANSLGAPGSFLRSVLTDPLSVARRQIAGGPAGLQRQLADHIDRVLANLELAGKKAALPALSHQAATVAVVARGIGNELARTLNDPMLSATFARWVIDHEGGPLATALGVAKDQRAVLKFAGGLTGTYDTLLRFLKGDISAPEAATVFHDLAVRTGQKPAAVLDAARRLVESELGSYSRYEIRLGQRFKDPHASGNFILSDLPGELSEHFFTSTVAVNAAGHPVWTGGRLTLTPHAATLLDGLAADLGRLAKGKMRATDPGVGTLGSQRIESLLTEIKDERFRFHRDAILREAAANKVTLSGSDLVKQVGQRIEAGQIKLIGDLEKAVGFTGTATDPERLALFKKLESWFQDEVPLTISIKGEDQFAAGPTPAYGTGYLAAQEIHLKQYRLVKQGADVRLMKFDQAGGVLNRDVGAGPILDGTGAPIDEATAASRIQQWEAYEYRLDHERTAWQNHLGNLDHQYRYWLGQRDRLNNEWHALQAAGRPQTELAAKAAEWQSADLNVNQLYNDLGAAHHEVTTRTTGIWDAYQIRRALSDQLGEVRLARFLKQLGHDDPKRFSFWTFNEAPSNPRGENYPRWRRDKDELSTRGNGFGPRDMEVFGAANVNFGKTNGFDGSLYYGETHLVLKPGVKSRSVYTWGSTSKLRGDFQGVLEDMLAEVGKAGTNGDAFLAAMLHQVTGAPGYIRTPFLYIEAHIFGGLDFTRDVEKITVPSNASLGLAPHDVVGWRDNLRTFARDNTITEGGVTTAAPITVEEWDRGGWTGATSVTPTSARDGFNAFYSAPPTAAAGSRAAVPSASWNLAKTTLEQHFTAFPGTRLANGAVLSKVPRDIAAAQALAPLRDTFTLVTHFDSNTGMARIGDLHISMDLVVRLFRSGRLGWRGERILVVGCGADALAAKLAKKLNVDTIGATHDVWQSPDGRLVTGTAAVAPDGTVLPAAQQPWWHDAGAGAPAPATPASQGTWILHRAGLFRPRQKLGPDLLPALQRLGLIDHVPTGPVPGGDLFKWGGAPPISAGEQKWLATTLALDPPDRADLLKAFVDQVFAGHPPVLDRPRRVVVLTGEMEGGGDIAAGLKTRDTLRAAYKDTTVSVDLVFTPSAYEKALERQKITGEFGADGLRDAWKSTEVRLERVAEARKWLSLDPAGRAAWKAELDPSKVRPLFRGRVQGTVNAITEWDRLDAAGIAELRRQVDFLSADIVVVTPVKVGSHSFQSEVPAWNLLEYGSPDAQPLSAGKELWQAFGAKPGALGLHMDHGLLDWSRTLAEVGATDPAAALTMRFDVLKNDESVSRVLTDVLFPGGENPEKLYFGYSNSDPGQMSFVAGRGFIAGDDFLEVVARVERGTTPVVDLVHVGRGYAARWNGWLADGRIDPAVRARFADAGVWKVEVVVFDDFARSVANSGEFVLGEAGGTTLRLSLVPVASKLDPFFKASEPLVLVTGNQSAAEAISAGKALLYEAPDHFAKSSMTRKKDFLDELIGWGDRLAGSPDAGSAMSTMLRGFNRYELEHLVTEVPALEQIAQLVRQDGHLAEWRDFTKLMADSHDANRRLVGMINRQLWQGSETAGQIGVLEEKLMGLADPTVHDLTAFQHELTELLTPPRPHEAEGRSWTGGPGPGPLPDEPPSVVITMEPFVESGVFHHPLLPGRGTMLQDGLLLSERPREISLAGGIPHYEGVFRLVTHYYKPLRVLRINGVSVPLETAIDYFRSGLTGWRAGQPILVVGCGADDLAELLRTELDVATIGATHDVNTMHDGVNYVGEWLDDANGTIRPWTAQPWWLAAPKVLEAGALSDGTTTWKLFLTGAMEDRPYLLGSDLEGAMRLLGFRRTERNPMGHPGTVRPDSVVIEMGSWAPRAVDVTNAGGVYHITFDDAAVLQNPHLLSADLDQRHLTVAPGPAADETSLGQFCGWLSVHWLTQTGHDAPLGFSQLAPAVQDAALDRVTQWHVGAADAAGHVRIESQNAYARAALLLDGRPAITFTGANALDHFGATLDQLPAETRILFATDTHSMAAVVLDDGRIQMYDPNHAHLPAPMSRDEFRQFLASRTVGTVFHDDRPPVPPPHDDFGDGGSEISGNETWYSADSQSFHTAETESVLTHETESVLSDDTAGSLGSFVSAENLYDHIPVRTRAGHATGRYFVIDRTIDRWAEVGPGTDLGTAALWDGSHAGYNSKGTATLRPNGDILLHGTDGRVFYSMEALGNDRYLEVLRGQDGKRYWLTWHGTGDQKVLQARGTRVYDNDPDGAVYRDYCSGGLTPQLVRHVRVTSDKGLIRYDQEPGGWFWKRFDQHGTLVARGRRIEGPRGWQDIRTFANADGTVTEVVVARQWNRLNFWDRLLHFREHTIDPNDAVRTRYTYKEFAPQGKEVGSSELLTPNRVLTTQRVAEQRLPIWLAGWLRGVDADTRGVFGPIDFADASLVGDTEFQVWVWEERGIGADGEIDATAQRAAGLRVAIPDGSTYDYVHWDGVDSPGHLVRSVVKLDTGNTLEVGRDPATGRWAQVPAVRPAGPGGRTVNWRELNSRKEVVAAGIRTFDADGRTWTDTLADGTVVRSVDARGQVTYHLGADTTLVRDTMGRIVRRTDRFPTGTGGFTAVEGFGSQAKSAWHWRIAGSDGVGGTRISFRHGTANGSWDDSFTDFTRIAGTGVDQRIRELRALDKGRALVAYRSDDRWLSEIRRPDGRAEPGSAVTVRQWRHADGSWQATPPTGTGPVAWRDVRVEDAVDFQHPVVLRESSPQGRVRIYGLREDGTPNTDLWTEYDHGAVFRDRRQVGVNARGLAVFRETESFRGTWRETLADGTLLRYRTLSGRIHSSDAFGRWHVGAPDTVGREYEWRGWANEFRGYNRMWREPNRSAYETVDGAAGEFVGQGRQLAQKVLIDFLQDYAFDVLANVIVTGAANNWQFSPDDWGKILAGGAVSAGVKSVSTTIQETLLKHVKDGIGNVDGGKFAGRTPYNHDKSWDNDWAGNENPRRWRGGLYDYGVNTLITGAVAGFVSTAFTSAVFGVGKDHVKLTGLDALRAGGLGAAGVLIPGAFITGPRTALHQLASGRYFHQGGIADLLLVFGEKTFEKWMIGGVLIPQGFPWAKPTAPPPPPPPPPAPVPPPQAPASAGSTQHTAQ